MKRRELLNNLGKEKVEILAEIAETLMTERKYEIGSYKDTENGLLVIEESIAIQPKNLFKNLADEMNTKHEIEWASYGKGNKNRQIKYTDIPASETYASIWESMLVIADEYTIEDLEIIAEYLKNNDDKQVDNSLVAIFISKTRALASLLVKNYLIASTKKDRNGKMIGSTEVNFTALDNEENDMEIPSGAGGFANKLESTAEGTRNPEIELFGANEDTALKLWFLDNMENILTKKQIAFVKGEVEVNKQQAYSFRKGIAKRITTALEKEFGVNKGNHDRLIKLRREKKMLEELLDSKNFASELEKILSKEREYDGRINIVETALVEFCTLTETRNYRMAKVKTKEVTKPLRVALYKQLNEIEIAIESWENYTPQKVVATERDNNKVKEEYRKSLISEVTTFVDKNLVEKATKKLESAKRARYSETVWFNTIAQASNELMEVRMAHSLLEKNANMTPEKYAKRIKTEMEQAIIWK